MTIVTISIIHVILYCIKLTVTRKLLPTRQCNRVWTWKWDDETHLLICLKRGSTILRNSAGSMTSSSSSISPRNITCHHTDTCTSTWSITTLQLTGAACHVLRKQMSLVSSDCFWTVQLSGYSAGVRKGDCSIIAVLCQTQSVLGWVTMSGFNSQCQKFISV